MVIDCPSPVLTAFRVVEDGDDITSNVVLKHKFNPRQVELVSEIPITGFIEII